MDIYTRKRGGDLSRVAPVAANSALETNVIPSHMTAGHALSTTIKELRPVRDELVRQAVLDKLQGTSGESERALRDRFINLRSEAEALAIEIMMRTAPDNLSMSGNERFVGVFDQNVEGSDGNG